MGTSEVTEIVLGYTPVEIHPAIGGIQTCQYVEIVYGFGILPFSKGGPAPEHKDVLVILAETGQHDGEREDKGQSQSFHINIFSD